MNYRVLVSELWPDKEELLDGRDLYSTVASYFELAFVFQLEYPTEAQTVITLMQLTVARYRDESGTLTASRKETMFNKVRKCFLLLVIFLCKLNLC